MDPVLGAAARTRASNEFAATVGPVVTELRNAGMSLRQIATLSAGHVRVLGARRAASEAQR